MSPTLSHESLTEVAELRPHEPQGDSHEVIERAQRLGVAYRQARAGPRGRSPARLAPPEVHAIAWKGAAMSVTVRPYQRGARDGWWT